jgi:hypothetical protein
MPALDVPDKTTVPKVVVLAQIYHGRYGLVPSGRPMKNGRACIPQVRPPIGKVPLEGGRGRHAVSRRPSSLPDIGSEKVVPLVIRGTIPIGVLLYDFGPRKINREPVRVLKRRTADAGDEHVILDGRADIPALLCSNTTGLETHTEILEIHVLIELVLLKG